MHLRFNESAEYGWYYIMDGSGTASFLLVFWLQACLFHALLCFEDVGNLSG